MSRWVTAVLAVMAVATVGLIVFDRRNDAPSKVVSPSGDKPDKKVTPSSATIEDRQVFLDVTSKSGIDFIHVLGDDMRYHFPELMGGGGAFIDFDRDGDLDLFLVQSGDILDNSGKHRSQLYRNDGSGTFTNVSASSGADIDGYGMGCAAGDYNNDGFVDLYVTRLREDALLRNNGDGTFTDVTDAAGISNDAFSSSASFFDFDRDGNLDIFVTNYVQWSMHTEVQCFAKSGAQDYCDPNQYTPTVDKLFRGRGDGTFEDVSEKAGIAGYKGNGLAVLCTDLNDDGWVDVYVANDQTPAHYWVNQRDGTFIEDAAVSGCAFSRDGIAIAGMGIAAEDFDGDADYDLLVTNIRDQAHLCLRNEGGAFVDVSHEWGFGGWALPYTAFGIAVFDQDRNGDLEVFIANGAVIRLPEPFRSGDFYAMPNQFISRNSNTGRYEDVSAALGTPLQALDVSRGVISGDYDNDGDIDIIVTNNHARPQILENTATVGNWTRIELKRATGGYAINARVKVTAGGRTQHREVRPGQGYLVSCDPRIHVGLADASVIDKLTIQWPDGATEVHENQPVNQHLIFTQGQSN